MEDLSVSSFLGEIWEFIASIFEPLKFINWDIGDWTFFMPILFWFAYWVYARIRQQDRDSKITAWVLVAGILFGGVFEHYQTLLEQCLPNGAGTCVFDEETSDGKAPEG